MSLGFHQSFPRGGRGIACRSSQSLVDTESQGGTGGHGKHLLLKETRLLRTAKHAKRKPSPQPDLSQNQPTNTRPPTLPRAPNAKIPKNSTTFHLFPTEASRLLHLLPEVQTLLAFHAAHQDCSSWRPLLILCSRLPGSCEHPFNSDLWDKAPPPSSR